MLDPSFAVSHFINSRDVVKISLATPQKKNDYLLCILQF